MKHRFSIVFLVVVVVVVVVNVLTCCRDQQLTSDTEARLQFSADSINFDTVFTAQGSSTRILTVYNPNKNAVRISKVWWQKGEKFFANLDGENNTSRWQDIDLFGGDSMYLFVRTEIDPYGSNTHPIEVDTLYFLVNGNRQHIAVQAFGMDVERIYGPKHIQGDYTLSAAKPYLIYDTLEVDGTLTIEAGTTCYMHTHSRIIVRGDMVAKGTYTAPIRLMGDRTDYLFPQVPYRVASGQWGGIFLTDTIGGHTYQLENIHLLSGQVGLYAYAKKENPLPHLYLHNARVHNMSAYGLVLENIDADLSNLEVSNCASYGMYLAGGIHCVEQVSVANYFGYPYTTLNIHSSSRENVAAVYVLTASMDHALSQSSFHNCILTGAIQPALLIDSIPENGYTGEVTGCYVSSDSLPTTWAHNNMYGQATDTVFKNTYYRYQEYIYYDFHLSPRSPARKIGLPIDSLQMKDRLQYDLDNQPREAEHPDAGCYSNAAE